MKKSFHHKLNRDMYEIIAGDYHAAGEKNIVFTTLLGSCISVCLKDSITGIAGINHFMLPGRVTAEEITGSDDARYGINAMELLINSMMKLGAQRDFLQAKIFGGGQVLGFAHNNIASANIAFVLAFLKMEEIPLLASDVGGKEGRKLFFFPDTFSIYIKRIACGSILQTTVQNEGRFLQRIRRQRHEGSELIIFHR